MRLLIPLLLYDLLLNPLVFYIAGGLRGSYWSYYGNYLIHVGGSIGIGPSWFIEVLLLFSLLYVAWRGLSRQRPHAAERPGKLPSTRAIYGFIFALALVSFVVRIWWSAFSRPFNLPVGYFPQYISFYILGLIAYRRNWFFALTPRMGKDWLRTALIALLVVLLVMIPFMMSGAGTQLASFIKPRRKTPDF